MVIGVTCILALTGVLSRWWGLSHHQPWLFAAMGASAMLMVGTPSSPMAQPWPVLVGSLVSGLAGWGAAVLVPDPIGAAAVAVGLAVMVMMVTRSLHPPGAALAMWMAMEDTPSLDLLAYPVCTNLLALVVLAVIYNRVTGKRYPAPQHSKAAAPASPRSAHIEGADLDTALSRFNGVLDVSRADLEALLAVASQAAFKRTLGNLRCEDIMVSPVHVTTSAVPQQDAWLVMQKQGVKALPVIDANNAVLGIVTATDLLTHALAAPSPKPGIATRFKSLVLRKKMAPVVVQDLMTADVVTVNSLDRVVDLIPVFSKGRLRHLPVVNAQGKLVGMITQTDLIRVMAEALAPVNDA